MGTSNRPRLIFALAVLFGINTMNFYDRQTLAAVQEKVRVLWQLTDSQLGWLGTAFILLYAVVGLPLGRMADVGRRKIILAVGCGLWSLLTFGSGFAWSFASLFVLRLGVGVGEASCAPAANSLIGDLVPPGQRARALAIFMLGLPVGLALSSSVSGTIAQYTHIQVGLHVERPGVKADPSQPTPKIETDVQGETTGWQASFFVAGFPGLLLALAVLFINEPVRGAADAHAPPVSGSASFGGGPAHGPPASGGASFGASRPHDPPVSHGLSFGASIARIFSLPTMWWIIASGALHNFNMYALGSFLPSLLFRYHNIDVARAGQVTGLIQGVGALSIFAAGWLGDRAYRRGVSGRLHIAWIGLLAAVPCLLLSLAAPANTIWVCAAWMLPGYGLLYFYYGTVYASIQDIIEPALRGTAMAVYFCGQYLLGAALGPVGTGIISDFFARREALSRGSADITGMDKAVGLHNAMYVVPLLNGILVLVIIAATMTVKSDYLRRRKREADAAAALGFGSAGSASTQFTSERPPSINPTGIVTERNDEQPN
jgi:MFS family permease